MQVLICRITNSSSAWWWSRESQTAFSEALPCTMHSWDDVIWQVSECFNPSSASGDFLPASQQRQHWFAELRITLWVRAVVLSHTAFVWKLSLWTIFWERKSFLLRLESSMVSNALGWKRKERGSKEVIVCRVKQRNSHGRWSQPTALQGRASHLSGSASGSPDWCHGQLPRSQVPRGDELAHQMNNSLCTPNGSSLAQG